MAHSMTIDPYLLDNFALMKAFNKKLYWAYWADQNSADLRGPVGGELSRTIARNFNASSSSTKLTIYSAHDTTLISLYAALGILQPDSEMLYPYYASSVVFEVRKC